MAEGRKNNFILHGSILAIAGIVVRIIGMLYRIPVVNIIGSEGNGIYGTAYNVYNIMLVLSSYGLPMAVSKLVSARFTKRRFKSARQVLICSLSVAAFTGGIAAALVFFGADFIEKYIYGGGVAGIAIPLRVLAPTIFLVAILGTIRGFFQGQGNMIPTAISQIIEQIVNAVVSIVAGYLLMKEFADNANGSAYGAAGSTLGTAMGALSALLFMLVLYFAYRPTFNRRIAKDKHKITKSNSDIYKIIITTMIPIILGQTFYQISALLDDVMFSNIMVGNMTASQIAMDLGNFSSSYSLLIGIPQGVASAMSASMLPSIVSSYTDKNIRDVHGKINKTLQTNMFIAIPSFVGLFVLGQPIIQLLFSRYDSVQGSTMLKIGAIAVVFYTLSTVTSSALQGVNKMNIPMRNSFISLVIHMVAVFMLLKFTKLGIYAIVIGNMTFPIIIFILNCVELYRDINYKIAVKKVFAKPLISSCIMGIATFAVYKGLTAAGAGNLLLILIAMIVALLSYFLPYILLSKKTDL